MGNRELSVDAQIEWSIIDSCTIKSETIFSNENKKISREFNFINGTMKKFSCINGIEEKPIKEKLSHIGSKDMEYCKKGLKKLLDELPKKEKVCKNLSANA